MADSPWLRRVMVQVENIAQARSRYVLAIRNYYPPTQLAAKNDERTARRRLRALLREKEGPDGR